MGNQRKESSNKQIICGKCSETILNKPQKSEEQSIECDCCMHFFHIVCVGVSERKMKAVTEFEVHWYCPSCEFGAATLKQQCVTLKAEQAKIKSDIQNINKSIKKFDDKLKTLETNLSNKIDEKIDELDLKLSNQINSGDGNGESLENESTQELIKTLVDKVHEIEEKLDSDAGHDEDSDRNLREAHDPKEIQDMVSKQLEQRLQQDEETKLREKKKNNLIFFNIPEVELESQEDRMKEDFYRIQEAYTGKVHLVESDVSHVIRIGKKASEKSRPVILTFKNEDKRMEVLRKNRDLKIKTDDHQIINLIVTTDKTIKQRETEKALREEIKERTAKGESNLVIRNEKIVPFRPVAQKSWAALFH